MTRCVGCGKWHSLFTFSALHLTYWCNIMRRFYYLERR